MPSEQNSRNSFSGSVIEILTLLIAFVQAGALIAFFIIYQGNYYNSSSKLSTVQTSLAQVEQQLKGVELAFATQQKALEVFKANADNAEKSLQILERIRPHTEIGVDPKIRVSGNEYEVHFALKNSGQHLIKARPKEFYILRNPVDNQSEIRKDDLIEHSIIKSPTVTDINPAETITHRYFFRLKSKQAKTFYFYVNYIMETDPVIVQQVEKFAEPLKLSNVKELTSVIESFEGSIEISRSNKAN